MDLGSTAKATVWNRFGDFFLRAAWVLGYAALVQVFIIAKKLEGGNRLKNRDLAQQEAEQGQGG